MLAWIFGLAAVLVLLLFSITTVACFLQHWSQRPASGEAADATTLATIPRELGYIPEEDRANFFHLWSSIQERFAEDAGRAVLYADMLLSDLMQEYGWDVTDWDRRVDQMECSYTAAHAFAARVKQGQVSIGELEQAMEIYRLLFDEILGGAEAVAPFEPKAA